MSASKIAARTRRILAERELTQSNRSGRISSKHGGHTARNRRRHGIGANRLHHHLQIERFLANAQIIIEQREADGAGRRHEDASNEVAQLRENRQENPELQLLGADGKEKHKRELKHRYDAPNYYNIQQVNHECSAGKIPREIKT